MTTRLKSWMWLTQADSGCLTWSSWSVWGRRLGMKHPPANVWWLDAYVTRPRILWRWNLKASWRTPPRWAWAWAELDHQASGRWGSCKDLLMTTPHPDDSTCRLPWRPWGTFCLTYQAWRGPPMMSLISSSWVLEILRKPKEATWRIWAARTEHRRCSWRA